MGRIISKSYGEKDYKGFILLKNKKNNAITRHYISSVDYDIAGRNTVNIWLRSKGGDIVKKYKMGSNKKADIGIKTWVKERYKQKMRVDPKLPDSCWDFVKE